LISVLPLSSRFGEGMFWSILLQCDWLHHCLERLDMMHSGLGLCLPVHARVSQGAVLYTVCVEQNEHTSIFQNQRRNFCPLVNVADRTPIDYCRLIF
jgi:hypothetical protein